jgi:hypothetical protein
MDYYFVKTKTDKKIYHLGWSWEERYRALSLILQYFIDESEIQYLREGELTDDEYENSIPALKAFGCLKLDVEPLSHEKFTQYYRKN